MCVMTLNPHTSPVEKARQLSGLIDSIGQGGWGKASGGLSGVVAVSFVFRVPESGTYFLPFRSPASSFTTIAYTVDSASSW